MTSPVLRSSARLLVPLMLLFSVFLLVRGHNAPGGGFVGGLVTAAALACVLFAEGRDVARQLLRVEPRTVVATGLLVALGSGLPQLVAGAPFMAGRWFATPLPVVGKLGSPVLFDIGVYLVVFGIVATMLIALAEEDA